MQVSPPQNSSEEQLCHVAIVLSVFFLVLRRDSLKKQIQSNAPLFNVGRGTSTLHLLKPLESSETQEVTN